MLRLPLLFCALFLLPVACKPPAADDYVARVGIERREAPSEPIDSPNTEGAIWARSGGGSRIIYGKPGERPLMALACEMRDGAPVVAYTRFARADAHAKAILALIGNSHVARLKIDAERSGEVWIWKGTVPAESPELEALTGPRQIEATVPGAGSVILNPSAEPGALIAQCRSLVGERAETSSEEEFPEAAE
ncbi:MAG: hypothetical protein ACR2FJ_06195 [Qipengyuania sp.]